MAKREREIVTKAMKAVKSKNTSLELLLGKCMWSRGLRYRKNNKKVFGKPDFTFNKYKIAIFCDGNFWHGKDWVRLNKQSTTNRKYWVTKILKNIERDRLVTETLQLQGWTVLRFWEDEIYKRTEYCCSVVIQAIKDKLNTLV